MSKIQQQHNQAMDLAEEAFLLRRRGDEEQAKNLFLQAMNLEYEIATTMLPEAEAEPSRSILYRSTAALAYHAQDYVRALQLIADGLRGYPPPEIEAELKELRADILTLQHAKYVQGILKSADNLKSNGQYGTVQLLDTASAQPVAVRVPIAKMRDIVRSYFDELVIITASQKGRYTYLENIARAYVQS